MGKVNLDGLPVSMAGANTGNTAVVRLTELEKWLEEREAKAPPSQAGTVIQCPMCSDFDPDATCQMCSVISAEVRKDWELSVQCAQPVPNTGMIPVKASTILAVNSVLVNAVAAQASVAGIPSNCDVRKILLDVVPGDGSGFEVFAKSCDDVVTKLSELGDRAEEWEAQFRTAEHQLKQAPAVAVPPEKLSGKFTYCGAPARFLTALKMLPGSNNPYRYAIAWSTKNGWEHITTVTASDHDIEAVKS